ncbi:MAG: hypothetical protein ACPL68_07660, partial [Candidatus Hydrothermia bacterium]
MNEEPSVGDLIFLRNTGLLPWFIRFWTRRGAPGGHKGYNHVAICVGNDEWLSAEPRGVALRGLGEL